MIILCSSCGCFMGFKQSHSEFCAAHQMCDPCNLTFEAENNDWLDMVERETLRHEERMTNG